MNHQIILKLLLIGIYFDISLVQSSFTDQHLTPINCLSKGDRLYDFLNKNGHHEMYKLLRSSNLDNYLKSFEYTLISPSDDAFALISPKIRQKLVNNTEYRLNFIKNHLIKGRLFLSSIFDGQTLINSVASNNRIHIAAYSNGYLINGARLLSIDRQIDCTRNLVQFVDKPIYLETPLDLLEYLDKNYKQFHRLIKIFQSQDVLFEENKEYTIFAPSDEAFLTLPWLVIKEMYNNNTFLTNVLKNHIIKGIHYTLGLKNKHKSFSWLQSQNGEKIQLRTEKLQGKDVVFVNEIPIINGDQLVKNGIVHEINRLIIPTKLMDNYINRPDSIIDNYNRFVSLLPINANLINKEMPNDLSVYYNNFTINQNKSIKSTKIFESIEKNFTNSDNKKYEPIISNQKNQMNRKDKSTIFRPMVFYEKSDTNYSYTINSKIPVSYHSNHRYYDSNKSNLAHNKTFINEKLNDNFFYVKNNNDSLMFPVNSRLNYSKLNEQNVKKNKTNQKLVNSKSKSQSHIFTTNKNQLSPTTIYYLTQIEHKNKNDKRPQSTSGNLSLIYKTEKIGLPKLSLQKIKDFEQYSTFKPSFNTKSIFDIALSTMNSSLKNTAHHSTKIESQNFSPVSKNKRPTSSKYYNDLTTPTPIYFDSTRKPKSANHNFKMRKINEYSNMNSFNLQKSYDIIDSNIMQRKIEDPIILSNKNQQEVSHKILKSSIDSLENEYFQNRFNNKKIHNQNLIFITPTNNSNSDFSNKNQTFSSFRRGRMRNSNHFGSNKSLITLSDVLHNPYLMIKNKPIKFDFFEDLFIQTNLTNLLRSNKGRFTLILPTNLSFKKLKNNELNYLKLEKKLYVDSSFYHHAERKKRQTYASKNEKNRLQKIKNLIFNHISPIFIDPESISNPVNIKTYSNYNLQFNRKLNKLYVNNILVLANTVVSNGVAYVIDSLIMTNNTLLDEDDQLNFRLNDTLISQNKTKLDFIELNKSKNVIEIMGNLSELSFFTNLVKKSNYSNELASLNGIYTVLAPENKAFNYLSHHLIDLLKNAPTFIDKFVGNHIINANFSIQNLIVSPIVLNLYNLPIRVKIDKDTILLNDTSIIKKKNIATSTGFLHILTHSLINSDPYTPNNIVMLNKKPTLQDQLMEIAKSKFSTKFLIFFIQNNYINMLKNMKKNFTLILPPDIGYYSSLDGKISKIENDTSKLKIFLNYHLLNQLFDPYILQTIDQVSSFAGIPIHYVNATAMNKELISQSHSKKLINYSNIFNKINSSKSLMINQKVSTNQLYNIHKIINQLRTHSEANQLIISGAKIREIQLIEYENEYSEISKKNYVEIIFVDRVLCTPKGTIYDFIENSPILTILYHLVKVANLRDELDWILDKHHKNNNEFQTHKIEKLNGFTFFAPSDSAFLQRLGIDVVEKLEKNIETARVFVLRHLIKKPVFTSSIPLNGSIIENSTGEHLNLHKRGEVVTIEDVVVEVADITTTNGVIHIIENVL